MYIKKSDLIGADHNFLRDFMTQAIPEDHYIDYKRELKKKPNNEEKIEYLKDVSAFANASGGNIIFGAEEPKEKKKPDDLLVGIDDGEKIAKEFERFLGSCIEPRIPGLQVVPVPIKDGKAIIIVHIPPSTSKPHLVRYKKHRCYYVRRSEESTMMGSHEIREQVLFAATSEARVERYLREREDEFKKYVDMQSPKFFFQAIPTISIDPEWEVLNTDTKSIIENIGSRKSATNKWLTQLRYRLTLAGVEGRQIIDEKTDEYLRISRNGYISAAVYNLVKNGRLIEEHLSLLDEYFHICNVLINLHNTDVPYLVRFRYYGAQGAKFMYGSSVDPTHSAPFDMEVINLDDQIRLVGQDFMEISDKMREQLLNAFGLDKSDVPRAGNCPHPH